MNCCKTVDGVPDPIGDVQVDNSIQNVKDEFGPLDLKDCCKLLDKVCPTVADRSYNEARMELHRYEIQSGLFHVGYKLYQDAYKCKDRSDLPWDIRIKYSTKFENIINTTLCNSIKKANLTNSSFLATLHTPDARYCVWCALLWHMGISEPIDMKIIKNDAKYTGIAKMKFSVVNNEIYFCSTSCYESWYQMIKIDFDNISKIKVLSINPSEIDVSKITNLEIATYDGLGSLIMRGINIRGSNIFFGDTKATLVEDKYGSVICIIPKIEEILSKTSTLIWIGNEFDYTCKVTAQVGHAVSNKLSFTYKNIPNPKIDSSKV